MKYTLTRRSFSEDGSARNFEPTEWAAASRQGWSDKVAEPLLREKYDQNPERSEWVAGTVASLSSNALIQCIANILSPIPWAPFYFFVEQGLGASRLVSLACYALTGRPRSGLTPAFHLSPAYAGSKFGGTSPAD